MLGNLGSLNIEQGRLELGREQSEAALAIHRDTGERIEEGQTLANIALLDQAAGRVEAARSTFFAALAIARDASNRRQEGVVLGHLGALESENGQLDAGAPALRPGARHPSRRRQSSLRAGMVLAQLGRPARRSRDGLDEARALLAEGEAQLRAVDEKLELMSLLCLRGRLELAAGESTRAQATLAEADSGARALDLDADSKLWKEIAALREAIGAGRSTAR